MDQDLYTAVKLLAGGLDLSEEAAEELLSVFEQVEQNPSQSVLYARNCSLSFETECPNYAKKIWVNGKRIYKHAFFFVIVETPAGRRIIAEVLPAAAL